jgi:serine/threonine protein phosphatase PrpC
MKIAIGKKTDIGRVREANEDSLYVELPQEGTDSSERYVLMLVADGMGGQVAGKEASETAVDVMTALFAAKAKTGKPLKDIKKFILDAFHDANQAVFEKGKSKAAEMGTTLTAALIDNKNAYIGHVGDSRAYLLRGREIRQLTEDHTLATDMLKKGRATAEEMRTSPMRSMLTRSIGTKEEVVVDDPVGIELADGDVLVLCTDGLTNLVEEQEILSAVHNTTDVQKACDTLVDKARKQGGYDNITVIAAEFGDMQRIKGLGIRTKTIPVKAKRGVKRRGIIIASIGILVALFMFLTYLFISHYVAQVRFYQRPTGPGQTDGEGRSAP